MSQATGAYITQQGTIPINANRAVTTITVANTGDRAIQVGSHYHFFEVNAALHFDRHAAYGKHLNIPSGLAIRFEPGDTRSVELVDFGGRRILYGFANLVDGPLDEHTTRAQAMQRLQEFLDHSNADHTQDTHP